MKVRGLLFGGLSTLALVLTACPSPVNLGIKDVTFAAASPTTVAVGQSITLQATANRVAGNTTAAQTVTYTSDKPAVLTVNSTTGVATGVSVGTAKVTAKSTVDTSKTAVWTVTVTAASTTGTVAQYTATTLASMPTGWTAAPAGTFTCTASSGTPSGSTPATVDPGDGSQGAPAYADTVVTAANAAPEAVYHANAFCHNDGTQGDTLNVNLTAPSAGTYTVRLHFSENYWGVPGGGTPGAGSRVMDILAPGSTTPVNSTPLDVFTAAGGAHTAYVLDVPVGSQSGAFTVKIMAHVVSTTNGGGDPFVSAVELIQTGS
ncbi:MAG TPA: malectin domain-containing carbohydrate-binding protein [Deinococcales bacterium]|nr:malectin domain-containing carbohydrate-binding protein [Deinococcales bacterium]